MLPGKRMHNNYDDVIRCGAPQPSLNSATILFWAKPPSLKTANISSYRPYAIDVIAHIFKCEMDGGRKFGYYAAILSGKNDSGLRSLSTASSLRAPFSPAQEVIYIFTQEYTRSQQALTLTEANKLTCIPC